MIEEKMRIFLVGIGFGATAFYLFWAALREYRSAKEVQDLRREVNILRRNVDKLQATVFRLLSSRVDR